MEVKESESSSRQKRVECCGEVGWYGVLYFELEVLWGGDFDYKPAHASALPTVRDPKMVRVIFFFSCFFTSW